MTIAFVARRKGFLKVMGALVQAALDRGHRVVLLLDPSDTKPGEGVTDDDLAAWGKAERAEYRSGSRLTPVLEAACVEALVAPSLHYLLRTTGVESDIPAMRASGIRLFSVDYAFETVTSAPEGYLVIDTTFYTSEEQRRLHWRLGQAGFSALGPDIDRERRSAVCGSTMMDQLSVVDRARVRARYGLREDQPVIVLMSLKMGVDPWRQLLWGTWGDRARAAARVAWQPEARRALARGWRRGAPRALGLRGYRDLAEAAQALARRHGGVLVVKSRAKNADLPFLEQLADATVEDEGVYPYTSMELMAIADLCIHFQSGAVLEAAFAGVPSFSVAVPQHHLLEYTSESALGEVYASEPGGLQNFPGIVWSSQLREAAPRLRRASLDDFVVDPIARRRYVEKFLGFDDTRSSERVLDVIERTR